MGSGPDSERERLVALADDLSLPASDGTLDDFVERYHEDSERMASLLDEAERGEKPPRESVGTRSDDEYNALLELYDEPRTRPGGEGGLLDGLSVAVKDNIAAKDLRLSCGLESLNFVPSYDAVVVDRLLDAGASLVGKANMDAFALGPGGQWSEFGAVVNPRYPDRVSGGSSSGSGAAVAAGLVDVALGTDTGGSVRSPAACCGIVGVRPTHRLVPRYGVSELVPSLDTVGPLARDVETAASVLEAIAGYSIHDPTSSRVEPPSYVADLDDPDDLTVGLVRSAVEMADDDVAPVVEATAEALDGVEGLSATEVDLEFGEFDFWFRLLFGTEIGWLLRQSFTTRGLGTQYNREWHDALAEADLNEHIAERIYSGAFMDEMTDGASYVAARKKVLELKARMHAVLDEVDVMLVPSMRMLPPTPEAVLSPERRLKTNLTRPFSLASLPAVSVPAAEVDGLPVNVQVVGPEFGDREALQVARQVELLAE